MTLASILISFSRMQRGQGCDQVDRLSFRTFAANAVRLQLYALAYNLGNFMRTAGDAENGGAVVADQRTVKYSWGTTSIRVGLKFTEDPQFLSTCFAKVT